MLEIYCTAQSIYSFSKGKYWKLLFVRSLSRQLRRHQLPHQLQNVEGFLVGKDVSVVWLVRNLPKVMDMRTWLSIITVFFWDCPSNLIRSIGRWVLFRRLFALVYFMLDNIISLTFLTAAGYKAARTYTKRKQTCGNICNACSNFFSCTPINLYCTPKKVTFVLQK